MNTDDGRPAGFTRREAIGLLGLGPLVASAGESLPTSGVVRTVLIDCAPDALTGATLICSDFAAERLTTVIGGGVGCVVDRAGGRRTARQLRVLGRAAARCGVHVVASGSSLARPYPPDILRTSDASIADRLVDESIARRWGAFGEIRTSIAMHADERKYVRAVAGAHLRTGLPIFTSIDHEGCSKCALEQLDLFESLGVNPRSLCIVGIGGLDARAEWPTGTAASIARRGAFFGLESPQERARPSAESDARMVKWIQALHDAGHGGQLLVSAGLDRLVRTWRRAGGPDDVVRAIATDNPRRFLCFTPEALKPWARKPETVAGCRGGSS